MLNNSSCNIIDEIIKLIIDRDKISQLLDLNDDVTRDLNS